MVAIAAVVFFALALIFELAGYSVSVLNPTTLSTAGLLCIALHLAGIGTSRPARRSSRR